MMKVHEVYHVATYNCEVSGDEFDIYKERICGKHIGYDTWRLFTGSNMGPDGVILEYKDHKGDVLETFFSDEFNPGDQSLALSNLIDKIDDWTRRALDSQGKDNG